MKRIDERTVEFSKVELKALETLEDFQATGMSTPEAVEATLDVFKKAGRLSELDEEFIEYMKE